MDLVLECVTKKYATFSGRAQRKEYWLFFIAYAILYAIVTALDISLGMWDIMAGYGVLGVIMAVALFIPGLAVSVRRLHDTDRSGWWTLITIIPVVGIIGILILLSFKGTNGLNIYGPNPLSPQPDVAVRET